MCDPKYPFYMLPMVERYFKMKKPILSHKLLKMEAFKILTPKQVEELDEVNKKVENQG